MPKIEPLNYQAHGHLKMQAPFPASHFIQVFDSELATAATRCPVFFTKNPATGGFYAGVMLGFKAGEDLVSGSIDGGFQPLVTQCDGFLLQGGGIAINREHPRFGDTDGDPLFEELGEPSPRLRQIQRVLGQVHAGLRQTQSFIDALKTASLIEAIDVALTFDDGERLSLQGLYTVSLDRLRDLDEAALLALWRSGHLQLAYTVAASLKQIDRLARIRNARGGQQTARS